MKLILKLTAAVIMLSLGIRFAVNGEEYNEYFPKGYNYLNPNYFEIQETTESATIEPIADFRIKPARTYTLCTIQEEVSLGNYSLRFYDSLHQEILHNVKIKNRTDNRLLGITFETPFDAAYIRLAFTISKETAGIEIHRVDEYFLFFEGEEYPLDAGTYYQGAALDKKPILSGESGYYYTDVNNPIAIEDIKAGISAYDDVDGDLSGQITIFENLYSDNCHTTGTYPVTFQVSDTSGNVSEFVVYVVVADTEAPIISGTSHYILSPTEQLSMGFMMSNITVTDNYDPKPLIYLESDTYSPNYNVLGSYEVVFYATDSSGNRSTFSIGIDVEDHVAPVISGPDIITKTNRENKSLEEILQSYTAIDDYDGDITDRIQIIKDGYSQNPNRVGTWIIELWVLDYSDNIRTKTVQIVVEDKTGPVFYVDKTVITIELQENNLTASELVRTLQNTDTIRKGTPVNIISDGYTENKNTPGTYTIVLESEGEKMELEVNVIIPENEKSEQNNFFEKIWDFFVSIWERIKEFFKNLFLTEILSEQFFDGIRGYRIVSPFC